MHRAPFPKTFERNDAPRVSGYHVAFAAASVMLGIGALGLGLMLRHRHLEGLELELAPAAGVA